MLGHNPTNMSRLLNLKQTAESIVKTVQRAIGNPACYQEELFSAELLKDDFCVQLSKLLEGKIRERQTSNSNECPS